MHHREHNQQRGESRGRDRGGSRHERERSGRDERARRGSHGDDLGRSANEYQSGGEYLRGAASHRAGWPNVADEYMRSGDYADDVVGGDYVREYGGGRPFDRYNLGEDPNDRGQPRWRGPGRDDWRRPHQGYNEFGGFREYGGSRGRESLPGGNQARGGYGARGDYHGEQGDYASRPSGDYARGGEAGGYRGKGPRNYLRSDERIREDLCERLTEDDAIDASEIDLQVQDGVVTLQGEVGERWIKHRVEDMAEACSGVKDVVNQLRVDKGAG